MGELRDLQTISFAVTVGTLLRLPAPVAVTFRVTVALAPLARVPMLQVTAPGWAQLAVRWWAWAPRRARQSDWRVLLASKRRAIRHLMPVPTGARIGAAR